MSMHLGTDPLDIVLQRLDSLDQMHMRHWAEAEAQRQEDKREQRALVRAAAMLLLAFILVLATFTGYLTYRINELEKHTSDIEQQARDLEQRTKYKIEQLGGTW